MHDYICMHVCRTLYLRKESFVVISLPFIRDFACSFIFSADSAKAFHDKSRPILRPFSRIRWLWPGSTFDGIRIGIQIRGRPNRGDGGGGRGLAPAAERVAPGRRRKNLPGKSQMAWFVRSRPSPRNRKYISEKILCVSPSHSSFTRLFFHFPARLNFAAVCYFSPAVIQPQVVKKNPAFGNGTRLSFVRPAVFQSRFLSSFFAKNADWAEGNRLPLSSNSPAKFTSSFRFPLLPSFLCFCHALACLFLCLCVCERRWAINFSLSLNFFYFFSFQGEDNIEYFLGLTPSGIIVLRNRGKVGNYFWWVRKESHFRPFLSLDVYVYLHTRT